MWAPTMACLSILLRLLCPLDHWLVLPPPPLSCTSKHAIVCAEVDRQCEEICIPIPLDELTADDGAVCRFASVTEPCKWACYWTRFHEESPGITEIGAIFIGTELGDTEGIAR